LSRRSSVERMKELTGDEIADYSGCLYEGADSITILEPHELDTLLADARAQSDGAPFRVVTTKRSKNFGPEKMQGPFNIILHHTGGTFASDIVTLTEPNKGAGGQSVSANDLIAKDGTIYELVPSPKKAWHARSNNRNGWGIEIENRGLPSDPYPKAQVDAVVWRARERRRKLGIPADPARIKRHRDVQAGKVDTSDSFPWAEVRRRIVAPSDPTDDGRPAAGEFVLEKFNVAGVGLRYGVMATALAGALRSEGASAMSVHSAPTVAYTATRASLAVLRQGPRLVALGQPAADAVTQAGHKLGSESKSDLFGAVGVGAGEDLMVADTIAKTLLLIDQIGAAETLNAVRIRKHFTDALVALSAYFADKV
jgi:N-acetyl-anhydromuramyl-L-alanine amidase AmpD